MNAGILLKIVRDVVNALETDGFLKEDGTFVFPDGVQPDVHLAGQVEALLKAHGVTVPVEVDRIIAAIPLILMLSGIQ